MIPKKVRGFFWKILNFSDFMLIFHQKITKLPNFWWQISIKLEKIKIFKKKPYNFIWNHVRSIWFKFQPIWAKIVTPDTIWVKFEKIASFHFWLFFGQNWSKFLLKLAEIGPDTPYMIPNKVIRGFFWKFWLLFILWKFFIEKSQSHQIFGEKLA